MKKSLALVGMLLGFLFSEAQIQTPAPSPAGSVSTNVGLTDIKIDYFRPRAKGRKIFGDGKDFLVPFNSTQPWRTGANSGTKITFSDNVKVEGVDVSKGEYLLLTWPGATEWTIALYKDVKLGGNVKDYNASNDAVKFKVKPEKLSERVETLTFNIADISDDSKNAKIQLAWENTSVKFNVTVDYDAKVMKSIETATVVHNNSYFQAAVYYFENGKDLKTAYDWIKKATDSDTNKERYWQWYQRAQIEKALGDKKAALASSTVSMTAATADQNRDYQKMNEELQKSLK